MLDRSYIFTTLFYVFCVAFILELQSSMRISKHGLPSIAPENLKRAPESFRLKLIVESPDFPAEEMAETEAWKGLQASVDAYADRSREMKSMRKIQSCSSRPAFFAWAHGSTPA